MHNKFITYSVMLIVVVAATVFLNTIVSASLYPPPEDIAADNQINLPSPAATTSNTVRPGSDYPSTLSVPSLGIEAAIQRVGINAKGNMASPSNYKDVAWYSKGTAPGMVGSAVIAGHFDNGLGLSGVFKNLTDIRSGDLVSVKSSAGKILKFKVTEIEYFDYDDPAATKIFLAEGNRKLIRLVTCGGVWIPESRTYDKRIIVTAELVE